MMSGEHHRISECVHGEFSPNGNWQNHRPRSDITNDISFLLLICSCDCASFVLASLFHVNRPTLVMSVPMNLNVSGSLRRSVWCGVRIYIHIMVAYQIHGDNDDDGNGRGVCE